MPGKHEIKMMTPATVVVILMMIVGGAVALYRLTAGLGAVTNLNDLWPWGMWISIDVLAGVAMAAGGFMIAASVYVFNMKKYKVIVRPAVLTAFIGYLLAVIAIFLDIGRPFRLYHPAIMWQINSIMFIVALHVIAYTTVLAMEFSPMLFEKFRMQGAYNFMQKIMVPTVIFGVLLSILHQSSLGAVFLLVPGKMHPLWYSSTLPLTFLISALMMGLSMVSFESIISSRAFKHKVPLDVLQGLARGLVIVSSFYLAVKLWLLVSGPGIGAAFDGSLEANMYLLEMVIGVVLPLALLLVGNARKGVDGLFTVNVLVIVGIILNRTNVGLFSFRREALARGADYFPSWMEVAVTLGLISLAVFVFKLAAKYLNLFPETEAEH